MEELPEWLRAAVRDAGAVGPGEVRAVVLEADGRLRCRDFASSDEARGYVEDASHEVEDGPVSAWVVDRDLRILHVGSGHRG